MTNGARITGCAFFVLFYYEANILVFAEIMLDSPILCQRLSR